MSTAATETYRERELKFDVDVSWTAPDPIELVPDGAVAAETRSIVSTYFDTVDRDLLRAGITLRRRVGGGDDGWQLKIPDGDARLEIRSPLDDDEPGRAVPAELRDLTAGLRGRAALRPVVTLHTDRAALRLADSTGLPLLEIVTDGVRAGAAAWTEVEVELLDGGTEKLLRRTRDLLLRTGATPSASASKLARALDAPTIGQRDPDLLPGVIGRYLDAQYEAVLRGDIDLRRDPAVEDPEVVHHARVATRRYRSVLRVFGAALDPDRAAALDVELAWYAGVLGDVRDRHVLREHLAAALAELPPELVLGPVQARIRTTLDGEERDALAALQAALRSARYVRLLRELRDWRADLPVVGVQQKAARVDRHLRVAQRRVDKRLAAATDATAGSGDAAFHRARKAAKRLRYAAELAEPVLGADARAIRKRAKRLQEHLGDRQDDVVAAAFLRRLGAAAGTTPGENGFTYGLLYEREIARGAAIRR